MDTTSYFPTRAWHHAVAFGLTLAVSTMLAACSGGGGSDRSAQVAPPAGVPPGLPSSPPASPPPSPPVTGPTFDDPFATMQSTSRLLTQASFGPTADGVNALVGTDFSSWLRKELSAPPYAYLPELEAYRAVVGTDELFNPITGNALTFAFWRNAIQGAGQLRQRMAYALSQLLVVSNFGGELLTDLPEPVMYYQDILSRNAFGNYRDLLEEVTYSPAMGFYLTYMGNQKADPASGRMPDENYAREILQLFTIGLVQLNPDGTPQLDGSGQPIELYDNSDITGLARVFTGLDLVDVVREAPDFDEYAHAPKFTQPMQVYPQFHSGRDKSFLGTTIPGGTSAAQAIAMALDHIMAHPNVGPFVGRQLIQRFTTSNPAPAYVERVAATFDRGVYTLPDGTTVGEGRKGDLAATIAAILLDPDNAIDIALADVRYGKLREPVLRLTHWARAFAADASSPEYRPEVYDTLAPEALSQHPFRARSVFNFYRPGYVAPGTRTGELGMTVPELQVVNASSTPGYMNFMTSIVFGDSNDVDEEALAELVIEFEDAGASFDVDSFTTSFVAVYEPLFSAAADASRLVDTLDSLLTYNTLTAATRLGVIEALEAIPLGDSRDVGGLAARVRFAVLMIMSSPDYLVQR